jgi:hypothetical protein
MHGLIPKPEITKKYFNGLMNLAKRNGSARIPVITPRNQRADLVFRTHRVKGVQRIEIDTHSCNWDISENGQASFLRLAKTNRNEVRESACGKCIMRVSVDHGDEGTQHALKWLGAMFEILGREENLREVKVV